VSVFVDTSALYALLNRNDEFHPHAAAWWADRLPAAERGIFTSEWVVLETGTILQRRLGVAGVRALRDGLLPVIDVLAVGSAVRDAALAAVIDSGSRQVSLVDRSSFELMRRRAIADAFSFDPDFRTAGFRTVPLEIPDETRTEDGDETVARD